MLTMAMKIALLWMLLVTSGTAMANQVIEDAVSSPGRSEVDLTADRNRKPGDVLEFLEIQPGMYVLDLFSGGGYYTEIVSRVVGESGKVVAHNNQAYLDYAADTLADRFQEGRLTNVRQLLAEADDLDLPPNSFDAVLAMLTWHDFYYVDEENGWPAIDAGRMVAELCNALKPGAILGLTDHVAASGSDPTETAQSLHRIDPARIKDDIESGCFRFEGEINVLRNPRDDLAQPMFAQDIRGNTDRVVFKFRKVSAE